MTSANAVLATRNQGKIAELNDLLNKFGMRIIGLDAFPQIGDITETGMSFAENALIKAKTVCDATGMIAIADDSGLVVDALGGAPGIYSARYSDDLPALPDETRDARNIRKLLHAMENIPENRRGARFVTAMAAAAPNGATLTATGEWLGSILSAPQGSNGFGYDPVFFDASLAKSAAQLTREEKSAVSHRGTALRALLQKWPVFMATAAL